MNVRRELPSHQPLHFLERANSCDIHIRSVVPFSTPFTSVPTFHVGGRNLQLQWDHNEFWSSETDTDDGAHGVRGTVGYSEI